MCLNCSRTQFNPLTWWGYYVIIILIIKLHITCFNGCQIVAIRHNNLLYNDALSHKIKMGLFIYGDWTCMVNVLKFRTLVACQKGFKTNSTDPDQIASEIWVFPVCYSDMHFVNSSPINQHCIREQKEKCSKFRTFTIIIFFPSWLTRLNSYSLLRHFLRFPFQTVWTQMMRTGLTKCLAWSESKQFDTLMVHDGRGRHYSWNVFSKKMILKKSEDNKKACKITQ